MKFAYVFSKEKADNNGIYAVADGISFPIDDVNDEVFSRKMMGEGLAISPCSSTITAPCNGTLTTIFPTGHAFGITREDGVEILVHIGLETVSLKGKGFKILKKANQKVAVGDQIVKVDLAYLKSQNMDTTILIIFLDTKEKTLDIKEYGKVRCAKSMISSIT